MTGKILIVDDVATNRIVLKVKLAAARYQSLQAGSGAEALRIIAREVPDLILLDTSLPDADGFDLCRRLRCTPATADVPVILTATDPEAAKAEVARMCEGLLANTVIEKYTVEII